jgi:adenylate cyclase
MLGEFKRLYGQIWINLSETPELEGRQFVEAYLDSEPNRLGVSFRQAIFSHTRGHPLFTVELLRDLQERGELIQDDRGYWIEGPTLDWTILPARVEGVIETRLGRLEPVATDTLEIASVIGEEFIAEVVAQVLDMDIRSLINLLDRVLDKKHHLISPYYVEKIKDQRLSIYRFRHHLIQKYLYNNLDAGRRMYLHEDIANILESTYAGRSEEIATQLARHYEEAGITDKALHYHYQAGVKAMRASANLEAISHFRSGLSLVNSLPEGAEKVHQEFLLQGNLILPLISLYGYGNPVVAGVIQRSLSLGKQAGNPPQLFLPVLGLGAYYGAIGDYQSAREVWLELLDLADATGDPLLGALSHWLGWVSLMEGKLDEADRHMRAVIDNVNWDENQDLALTYGVDPSAICRLWASWILWLRGYPKQARGMLQEALTIAEALNHPHTQAFVLGVGCHVLRWLGDYKTLNLWSQLAIKVSRELSNAKFLGDGLFSQGIFLVNRGKIQEGLDLMDQGLSTILETGSKIAYSANLVELSKIYLKLGDLENGLIKVQQALDWIAVSGERFMEAEIKRIEGELLFGLGESDGRVDSCFLEAIEVARRQSARSFELRASSSLYRFMRTRKSSDNAYLDLAQVYAWFSEGFDTPDLQVAKSLLDEGPWKP